MGDDPKQNHSEDHTIKVAGDALSKLREAAEQRAKEASAAPAQHKTSPQLRTLRSPRPMSTQEEAQRLRGALEEARTSGEDTESATKAIKRDSLVQLLKGEVREANAAEEAPSLGILKHTRPKGDTPQQLEAQARQRATTPQVIDASQRRIGQRPTVTSDLEELNRVLEQGDDPSESTRQVSVIPELRASLSRMRSQDPTQATDAAASQALKAMMAAGGADEGATRELGSMQELLRQARSGGDLEGAAPPRGLEQATTPHLAAEDSDYSLEEFSPSAGERGMEEESAASLHQSKRPEAEHEAHTATSPLAAPPARPDEAALVVAEEAAQDAAQEAAREALVAPAVQEAAPAPASAASASLELGAAAARPRALWGVIALLVLVILGVILAAALRG